MIAIIIILLKIVFFLFLFGLGPSALFLPKDIKNKVFYIPWLGTVFIIIISVYFSLAKIPLNLAKYYMLGIAGALILYAYWTKRLSMSKIKFNKENVILSFLIVFLLAFNLFPLWQKIGYPTSISAGNIDITTYVNVGDYLKTNTVWDGRIREPFKPYYWAVGDLLHANFRWGSPLLLGFLASLINSKSYQIFTILITLYFALSYPLVYLFSKALYKKSKSNYWLMSLTFITFGLNSNMLYILYNVFYAQMIFTGLFILMAIFLLHSIKNKKKELTATLASKLIMASIISSITTVYPEVLMFALVPIFLYYAYQIFVDKKAKNLKVLMSIILLTILINPFTFYTAFERNLRVFAYSLSHGWGALEHLPFASLFDLMGFYNLFYSRNLPLAFDFVLSVPILLVFIIAFIKVKNKAFLSSFLLPIIILLALYTWQNKKFFHFRIITYFLFLFSALFSIGMTSIISKFRKTLFKYLLILALLALSWRSAFRTIYQLYWHPLVINKALISLIDLNLNDNIKESFYTADVYLGEYCLWRRDWRGIFLKNKNIITRQNYPHEKQKYLDQTKLVLTEKSMMERNNIKVVYTKVIWENNYYILGEIKPIPVDKKLIRLVPD